MPRLPTGTLTYLFTDIEGSARLWEQHPSAMRTASLRHDRLVEAGVARHGGVLVRPRGEGDSRFAVFRFATHAVEAAAEIQQAFFRETWPEEAPLRVRMALHTGEADLRDGDYYGPAVNRCARLRSLAHGGQVLVSHSTGELVLDQLSLSLTLRSLGLHRLKDLERPEPVFQLIVPDVPAEFPPLPGAAVVHHLPVETTSFVGGEAQVEAVVSRLLRPDVPLLTLTGPGGGGKTRLARRVAAHVVSRFADGVYWVDLAAIPDPALVAPTLAHALHIRDAGAGSLTERLAVYLQDKQTLLVLDNFEHVMPAARILADLLRTAPLLKVLVTSREVLRLSGEHRYAVALLSVPRRSERLTAEQVSGCGSVRLFVERAQAVQAEFVLDDANAPVMAEICRQLEGLPLAIELAAARMQLFTPSVLLSRLANRLQLLTGGARDLPAKQQTVRATIEWSYELLSKEEQQLFHRLAVFQGGGSLEAIETLCREGLAIDPLEGLESLVGKSLIRQEPAPGSELRFRLLETLRDYAQERLEASGEAREIRRRHALYYLLLAEGLAFSHYEEGRADQVTVLREVAHEQGNLRAALNWTQGEPGEQELRDRLVIALWSFWVVRAHLSEGRRWVEQALSDGPSAETRRRLLPGAWVLAYFQGDHAAAKGYAEQLLELAEVQDHAWSRALAFHLLALEAQQEGDGPRALTLAQDCQVIAEKLGDPWLLSRPCLVQGLVAARQGECERAAEAWEEGLAQCRQIGNSWHSVIFLSHLGIALHALGRPDEGRALCREGLGLCRELEDIRGTLWCLVGLAGILTATDHLRQGARLLDLSDRLARMSGSVLPWMLEHYCEPYRTRLLSHREDLEGDADWSMALSLEDMIDYALEASTLLGG